MKIEGSMIWAWGVCCWALGCSDGAPAAPETCKDDGSALEGDGQRFVGMDVGSAKVCALAGDGGLYCWGDARSETPLRTALVPSATAVAIGSPQTCAVRPGGAVACWSDGDAKAELVPGLCGATALTAELESRCAVGRDGTVRCWGGLQAGVFGTSSSRRAVAVPGVSGALTVASGNNGYACALLSDGSVTCWGGGPRVNDRPSIEPAAVPEIAGAVALDGATGSGLEMCAALADGIVTCWSHALAPAPVPSLEDAVSVAHCWSHACAVLADGSVRCWGRNQTGQLGDGTQEDSDVPVTVEGISNAVSVSVGSRDSGIGTSCALLDDGTARCWGSNRHGMLGDGASVDSSTPVVVAFP